MAAAKPAPPTGSITGTKGVDIASASPTTSLISSTDLPPDAKVKDPSGYLTTLGAKKSEKPQAVFPTPKLPGEEQRKDPKKEGIQEYVSKEPGDYVRDILKGVVAPITKLGEGTFAQQALNAQGLVSIAQQLASGQSVGDIALQRAKGQAVKQAAKLATQEASKAAIQGLDLTGADAALAANLGIAGTPVIGAALNMALSGAPVTAENVAQSAMRSGLLAGPQIALAMQQAAQQAAIQSTVQAGIGYTGGGVSLAASAPATAAGAAAAALPFAAMMAIKAGIDIKQAQDKGLFRKRAYEDAAFSAPVVNLQPYMTRLSQPVEKGGTGHSVKEIQELFKPSRPDELNYLGGQLARELDPPDGAKYYHGDESTRKLMEKNLGIIQKYRNTIPAYADVWDKFSRGQISHPQFKAESQKAVDNYIVGKLGAKRVVKPGELWFRGEYLDMNKKENAQTYFEQTRKPPPGWGVYRGPEEDELYNFKERAEADARRRAEEEA